VGRRADHRRHDGVYAMACVGGNDMMPGSRAHVTHTPPPRQQPMVPVLHVWEPMTGSLDREQKEEQTNQEKKGQVHQHRHPGPRRI
jgi:hypothetical protein